MAVKTALTAVGGYVNVKYAGWHLTVAVPEGRKRTAQRFSAGNQSDES
jgi:hypothetical protein